MTDIDAPVRLSAENQNGPVFFAGVTERARTHGGGCAEIRPTDRGYAVIETNPVVLATPDEMRGYAHALLAAADATEQTTSEEGSRMAPPALTEETSR